LLDDRVTRGNRLLHHDLIIPRSLIGKGVRERGEEGRKRKRIERGVRRSMQESKKETRRKVRRRKKRRVRACNKGVRGLKLTAVKV